MSTLSMLALCALFQTSDVVEERIEYAVVVHADNATESLSSATLRRILKAQIQEWPSSSTIASSSTIKLLLPRSGTGEKQVLLDRVYDMTDLQLKRYWTGLIYQNKIVSAPHAVPSATVGLRMAQRLRSSITVVPASDVPEDAKVKVVPIDDKLPGESGYPLWLSQDVVNAVEASFEPAQVNASNAAAPVESAWTTLDDDDDEIRERLAVVEEQLAIQGDEGDGWIPFNLQAFAHMEWEGEEEKSDGETSTDNGFSFEVLDLVATASLSDRVSVLAETSIEARDEGDEKVEVERMLLKYRFGDYLNVQAGRFLTSFGYWNTRYHHGEWLQTSIDRPELLDFEDDSGLLPVHNVGLVLKGAYYTEALGIDYTVEIANGRGPTPDDVQVKEDENDKKAVNVNIGFEPSSLPGLRFGASAYVDRIPANNDDTEGAVHRKMDEVIKNVYCAYNDAEWEMMAEYFDLRHDDGLVTTNSEAWYFQIGRHFGRWTPYVRMDGLHRDDDETYWETTDDAKTTAFGVRWDFSDWAALTCQFERSDLEAEPGEDDERTDTLVLQGSFVF